MAKDRYHDWYKLYDKLSVEINPSPKELRQLFDQESPIDPINLSGLELKFEAATREQTVIEKTMSPAQLFQTNSPFWVVDLTITQIQNIQDLYPQIEPEAFFKHFDQLLDEKQYFNIRMMLWQQHRKETE